VTERRPRFAKKVVVVTGAGSGIGRGIACRFAEEGADVAIHDVNAEGAALTAKLVTERGSMGRVYVVDVSKAAECRSVLAATVTDFGGIDVIVNNAGINLYRRAFDYTDDEWDRIVGVNLTGTWNYCRYGGPYIFDRGGGSIVNVTSIASVSASYYRVPYMASKGGCGMLTKALALDLADLNIRVNAVAPGSVKTSISARAAEAGFGLATDAMIKAITPLHRWGEPEEIANAVLFLASDEARYITGTTLFVDGGMTAGNQIGMSWRPTAEPGTHIPWLDSTE
jgi:NAD(P)-dependent dehydrogenase (short-subunit alcohol dehydrogenase family)